MREKRCTNVVAIIRRVPPYRNTRVTFYYGMANTSAIILLLLIIVVVLIILIPQDFAIFADMPATMKTLKCYRQ